MEIIATSKIIPKNTIANFISLLNTKIIMAIAAVVIANQEARQGQALLAQLPLLLSEAGLSASVIAVTSQNIQSKLRHVLQSTPDVLIIAGGDGTVSTAINAIKGTPTTLGIIPAGTTNNLARSLNIPLEFSDALKVIIQGHTLDLSLGHIQLPDKTHSFSTAASIGLSAATIPNTKGTHKRVIGRLAYVLEGTKHLLQHQAFLCSLTIGSSPKTSRSFRTHEIIIANTQHQAGIPLSPEDLKEQPRLTVTILATRHSRLLHLWNFLKLLTGHTRTPTILQKTTSTISIKVYPSQPIEADGEDLGTYSNITITADPLKATILVPPT